MAELRVAPAVCAYSTESLENLHVEIELPGVAKEDINLRMQETSFTIDARREDIRYIGTYAINTPVDPEQAKASFRNGLLTVEVPYRERPTPEKVIPVSG